MHVGCKVEEKLGKNALKIMLLYWPDFNLKDC